ncbi:MAG TPA: GNAT family N-acetyltransferase, partial [Cellulomonas sp.]
EVRGTRDARAVVRPAIPEDAPGVVAVAATRGPQPPDQVERVAGWTVDPGRLVLVATAATDLERAPAEVVGWAVLARWQPADVPHGWYVSALTVTPSHRRVGLGARMLAGLLDWEPARGATVRSVVNATNLASVVLHERQGFREVARGRSFAGITFTGGTGVLLARDEHGDDEEQT